MIPKAYRKLLLVTFALVTAIIGYYKPSLFQITNYQSYEDQLLANYTHQLESFKASTPPYDPEEIYLAKLATNSYSQKLLLPEQRDDITPGRENATILMLVRNWELQTALESMRSLEDRFNRKYRYDWTFLNDVPFTGEFIEATTMMASGKTQYGLIPSEDWNRPSWIDEQRFEDALKQMAENGILYGDSKSYRNMCRFNSGFFFRQELLMKYDYYFRVEPEVQYYCDFQYDPFQVMRENNKKYGFILALHEYEETIPTLYDTVMDFFDENPQYLHPNNSKSFLTDTDSLATMEIKVDVPNEYNLCHFWSNFEIGDLNFFRSEAYIKFFEYLDEAGGFYYERWGDAPVHTLAAALLLGYDEMHYFEDFGYFHPPFGNCPSSNGIRLSKRCLCDYHDESVIDIEEHSCIPRWWKVGGKTFMKAKGEQI